MIEFFKAWPEILEIVFAADHLLVMLDFDGTLAPIVTRPADARVPEATRRVLLQLEVRNDVTLAFVSGRGVSDVRALIGISGAHYFGSHGRQRMRPGSLEVEVDTRYADAVRRMCDKLTADLGDVPGFAIENKIVSAAAHFRTVDPRRHEHVAAAVRQAVGESPYLTASPGKMVFDITPLDGVDKGTATVALLDEVGPPAFYFGDDRTDEAAFAALPPDAITVFVGPQGAASAARYRVEDPAAVGRALEAIAAVGRRLASAD